MSLFSEIMAVSHRASTKAEVVDYYRSEYRGRGAAGWKQNLIQDLLGIRGTTKEDVSKEEYARQAKNLAKRFEPKRIGTSEVGKTAEEYQLLGESLPPLPPEGGYRIHGTIYVKYSDDCVPREMDETITGDAAKELAKMASDEMLKAAANAYQSQDGDIDFKGPSPCAEPDLQVEAAEGEEGDGYRVYPSGLRRPARPAP